MTKEIERAERDLNNLEEQRNALFARAKTLAKERDQIAFAALTAGDKKAKDRLREINLEDISLTANVASVEAALTVARANLAAAKADEAKAADRTNALALREKLKKFIELGLILDDCFTDFRSAAIEMKSVLDDIHNLGQVAPTAMQFKINCDLAFKTAVMGTPFWSQDFPVLGHGQKKTFKSLVDAWSANIEANIAARLGDNKNEEAA
jgi:chromosome segregation ATPase